MVTPHIRRAHSGNVDRHIHRTMREMGVTCKQAASVTTVKNSGGRQCGSAVFVQQLRAEKQTGNVVSAQNGCARDTVSRQLQGTIILKINFIHIYFLNYISLSSNILCISLYINA